MTFPKTITTFVAATLLLAACQSSPKTSDTATSTETVIDSMAILNTRPGPDAPRSAADRLVRALYFEHNKTDNPFRQQDRALIEQYFAKPLADRIWARYGTKPATQNPLFNAPGVDAPGVASPDAAITKTWVNPAAVAGERAVVYVTFANRGNPQEIRVELTQYAGRWRITDMHYPDGSRLTGQLR